jgi:outer membrane protein assembly factor BamB
MAVWKRRVLSIGIELQSGMLTICLLAVAAAHADDWPQWRGPNRDGVWRETGVIDRFQAPEVLILWRVPVGPGYSGPTVYHGRVYVTDHRTTPELTERVLCFDQQTGKAEWQHEYPCVYRVSYPAGPRASVTCEDGRVYALGTMGHLHALRAADGTLLWKHDLQAKYDAKMPTWGFVAAPLIVGDVVIVQAAGRAACLVAFDKRTGVERWRSLDDPASYSPPVLVVQGGKPVVVCLTAANLVGLDPDSGKLHWQVPFPPADLPTNIVMPVLDSGRLFITAFYDGSLMVKLNDKEPTVETIWRRKGRNELHTDALHSDLSTPLFLGNHVYGVDSYGELRCLDAATGDRVWESRAAVPRARWSTIHMVRNADRIWMFNERGELIIARLSPAGYEELSRAKLIAPTTRQLNQRGGVCWSHPAYAGRCVFVRNDEELVCGNLAR